LGRVVDDEARSVEGSLMRLLTGCRNVLLATALGLVPQCASAYIVNFDPPGNATGISFLIVENASYDVTFEYGEYEDVFAGSQNPFSFISQELRAFSEAIAAALTTPALATTAGPSAGPYNELVLVPGAPFEDVFGHPAVFGGIVCGPDSLGIPGQWTHCGLYFDVPELPGLGPQTYAVVTRVPQPGTLSLLAPALALLALARLRCWLPRRDA
jgi:hypothetical protein